MKTSKKAMVTVVIIASAFIPMFFIGMYSVNAQGVGINPSGNPADPSALLDLNAAPANNKGLLIPRLTTTERDAITNPAQALQIYNITSKCFEVWENGFWQKMWCATCPVPAQPGSIS